MSWIGLECKNNETKARVEPMPKGPYLIVKQHEEGGIKGDDAKKYSEREWVDELPEYTWAKCAFVNENGKMRMVFYHWDCT